MDENISEWTIENFSCWRSELHGEFIQILIFSHIDKMKLYPRGLGGREEHMVMDLSKIRGKGEISLIGSDGYIFWKQQLDWDDEQWDGTEHPLILTQGPKFEEVVARIRENETEFGDRLTLLLKTRYPGLPTKERVLTVIDVFDTALKLHPLALVSKETIDLCEWIDGVDSHVHLRTDWNGYKNELQLLHLPFGRKTGLRVKIFVRSGGTAEIYAEKEHLLEYTPWTILDSPKIAEMVGKDIEILLQLKIVYGSMSTRMQRLNSRKTLGFVPMNSVDFPEDESSERETEREDSVTELTEDFMSLFQDQDFSDFTLKCETVTFPVHRNILSSRSAVFKTILSTDMTEAASGAVDITDLDASTLGLFLTYLYTGAVEEMQVESAIKLYYAADKYQVSSLKRKCTNFLSDNISISNVCDILSLADRHKDDELTAVSRYFILTHFNEISKSEDWRSLMQTQPLLVAETVTYFGERDLLA